MAKKRIVNNQNVKVDSNTPKTNSYAWSEVSTHSKLKQTLSRTQETQKTWRDGLRLAEDWNTPQRYQLYRVYRDVMTIDSHLRSLLKNRQNRLKQLDFDLYNGKGEIDTTEVYKFRKKWFNNVIDAFIETYFYGHSLLAIDSVAEGLITNVTTIDREYISPEFGLILDSYYNPKIGYDFRSDNPDNDYLIEIGGKRDLGLLSTLSSLALFKKADLQFWNLFIEMYGIPYRIGKVKSDDPKAIDNMYKHLKNMGAAGFAILNNNDTVEVMEGSSNTSPDVFYKMIDVVNAEMSKLVLGASGIVDGLQSGTQAQSNVHQLQLDVITKADVIDFEYFVNEYLLPKLIKLGVVNDGLQFYFKSPERIAQQFTKVELDSKVMGLVESGVFDTNYLVETYDYVPTTNKQSIKAEE